MPYSPKTKARRPLCLGLNTRAWAVLGGIAILIIATIVFAMAGANSVRSRGFTRHKAGSGVNERPLEASPDAKPLANILQGQTNDVASIRKMHPERVVDLAMASAHNRPGTTLAGLGIRDVHIPTLPCLDSYNVDRLGQLLGHCLPYAVRGPLVLLTSADPSRQDIVRDISLGAALGRAGFLVVLYTRQNAWPTESDDEVDRYRRAAPNVFVIVSSVEEDFVMGAHQYHDPIGAPMLVTGPPCRNGNQPDFAALEQAGSIVLLLLGEKVANAGSDEATFATEALCTGGVRSALSLHEAAVSMAQRLPEGCTRSAWLLQPALGQLGLYDAMAAQISEALAEGDRSWYLQPNAGVPLAGEGAEQIRLPSGKVTAPVSQCEKEYPVVLPRFLMHCLPGRRGFYVQATTIAFDVTRFQRPQHMSAALAKQNMLVMYVGYNRVIGSIMGTDVEGLFVADGLIAVSGQVSGAIVNIHSTMYDQTPANLDDLKIAGNAIIYEYIDVINEAITGSTTQALVALRSAATAKADLLVYTATTLREQLGHTRPPSHYAFVPNGVDPSMYEVNDQAAVPSALRAIVKHGKPIVGYFGSIAPWIWLDMVAELAQLVPEAEFVMIGPTTGSVSLPDKMHLPQNLHYLGPVAAKKLVLYGRHWSVGIIPFRKGEIAQTTSPLKLFEYFALGLPVVVTDDMHECMQFKDVLGASDARSFAAQVRVAISRAADPTFREATRKIAELNSWDVRAVSTLAALQLAMQEPHAQAA